MSKIGIDSNFIHFLIVAIFGFLVGLEIKSYRKEAIGESDNRYFFGDLRTFTFSAILGFVLFIIEPKFLYSLGFLAITLLFSLLYYKNLQDGKKSILLYLVLLLVYSLGALIQTQPIWVSALVYVSIVFVLNINEQIERFSKDLNTEEFQTLSKMVLFSAVILPLLPNTKVIPYIPLSPFKIWLSVVVISAISYGGYILQKYFFKSKGYYLTGILGGLYSSTATTVVLARKAKEIGGYKVLDAAIISATSVMYLRLIVIALIFNISIGKSLIIPFTTLSLIGFLISWVYLKRNLNTKEEVSIVDRNPLELKTAFLFSFLFIVMMIITNFVTKHYGKSGLEVLSFIVGFTDIDPFILSILTGKFVVTNTLLIAAIMIAAGSNNILKAIYALWFGGVKNTYISAFWIFLLGIITISWGLAIEFF